MRIVGFYHGFYNLGCCGHRNFFFSSNVLFSNNLQGFTLEDATGLAIKGEVDVHSVYATSLPRSHPSFSPQRVLEMSQTWKASPLPKSPIKLFIGVLSASNHFAERMAIRKTWMQSAAIKSSDIVLRFFVALVRLLPLYFSGKRLLVFVGKKKKYSLAKEGYYDSLRT